MTNCNKLWSLFTSLMLVKFVKETFTVHKVEGLLIVKPNGIVSTVHRMI